MARSSSSRPWALPAIAVILSVVYVVAPMFTRRSGGPFDVRTFARIPVLNGGRVKPIDTVARTSLLILSGKQNLRIKDQRSKPATDWLLDVLFAPERADAYEVFRIDDPDVLGLLGIQQTDQTRFSFSVLAPHLNEIDRQAAAASRLDAGRRSLFHTAIVNLSNRLNLYQRLQNTLQTAASPGMLESISSLQRDLAGIQVSPGSIPELPEEIKQRMMSLIQMCQLISAFAEFRPIALAHANRDDAAWATLGDAVLEGISRRTMHPDILSMFKMGDYYRKGDAESFNQTLRDYYRDLPGSVPERVDQTRYEELFNRLEPFYKAMVLYVLALLLSVGFWLFGNPLLSRTSFALVLVAFVVHSLGLVSRIVLQGRPPVTNLYSSAVFVGWGAVLFGIILEWLNRRAVGQVASAIIGFVTLIVAHHLSLQGDTMEMMRAVLDSNFWLTTHVVAITIGYSSTFLCGALAMLYLVRRAFDPRWSRDTAASLHRMVYGLLCFSAFFTFVGTVLGGIWADQSWGRFWGWDPKENGALLIVLWTLLILHARGGRLVGETGVMVLSVFGNIITAIAWFGVNMLNIGLHSYGYMDRGFTWLVIFTLAHLALMALGLIPPKAQTR